MRIGIDFDNTIICYDPLFVQAAQDLGLLSTPQTNWDKPRIRDHIRRQADGELKWQQLQAEVYAHRLPQARPKPGVQHALQQLAKAGFELVVVSHKTQHAKQDPHQVDLRQGARTWLQAHGFFKRGGGLDPQKLYFEPTRDEKIARITQLQCRLFVDDLIEVLTHPDFPPQTQAVLFAPCHADGAERPYDHFTHWAEIETALLDGTLV
ncbi:hypothetical protein [Magnetococcus sp. PR-3]|uniref:hypothetical protein n=1 Tax=Magnetococcus sp. PR-3 TaxID=3120355 RepID=UPI002FCE62D8